MMKLMICPYCKHYSEAIFVPDGEGYFGCPICCYADVIRTDDYEDFGTVLMHFRTTDLKRCVYLSYRKDGLFIVFWVLSDTETLYEGDDMFEATKIYGNRLAEIQEARN